ncbi:integrase arm-type DNA-binding domain-containing protein, partial [Serratia marcescens]
SLGKEKLLAIGVYPDVSLAEARSKREDAKRTLAAGNDPSLERKIEKLSRQQDAENSFEALTREWYQRRYDRWSVSYREEMMRTFEKDVFPY